jgi:hypothetical protein
VPLTEGAPRFGLCSRPFLSKVPVTDDAVLRRAVITGAVTLALFWDPTNSTLGGLRHFANFEAPRSSGSAETNEAF